MLNIELKLSEIKQLKSFCEGLHSEPYYKEVIDQLKGDFSDDFEIDNVRFIHSDHILSVMSDELQNDLYVLGCFTTPFICSNTSLNYDMVEACKESEAFEAIGKGIVSDLDGDLTDFAEDYTSLDGFGHHFNHYDGNEEELLINGQLYHVFDNH